MTEELHHQEAMHVYVLDNKKQRIGVFAATNNIAFPDMIYIGWSLCNFTAGDRFDTNLGVEIAYQRSFKGSIAPIPLSMLSVRRRDGTTVYDHFKMRCERYFKGKTVVG
jgi:hypothetical protein